MPRRPCQSITFSASLHSIYCNLSAEQLRIPLNSIDHSKLKADAKAEMSRQAKSNASQAYSAKGYCGKRAEAV
eukprot:scaffold70663_cov19-Prasinocladus_malaysianus.AAC.2